MKTVKILIIGLVLLVIGYALGNFFPLSNGIMPSSGVGGDQILQVELLIDNGTPLANIEVDVGEKPGPPPEGGTAFTDENGIATFSVKPGNYVVYFNDTNFPENLQMPETKEVEVKSDITNKVSIVVESK